MKKLFIPAVLLLFAGCSGSLIKIGGKLDNGDIYPMFGKIPEREFYTGSRMTDSLKLIWEGEANGGFTQSSVSAVDKYIFVNDLSGRIFCFDIETGKPAGQLKHKGPVYTTPLISRYNIIYAECIDDEDKSIIRVYNFLEGKPVSAKEIRGRIKSEMLLLDKEVFFCSENGLVYKFSYIGDQYWVQDIKSMVQSDPVSDGQHLYIAAWNGELIKMTNAKGDIEKTWNLGVQFTSGLSLHGDFILAGDKDGYVYMIDKNSGVIKWRYPTGSRIDAIPVVSGETVYAVNLGGSIAAIDAGSGKEKWRISTGGVLNSTPLVTDSYLIIPDLSGRIIIADRETGREVRVIELPNRAKLSPVIHRNILVIGFDRGVLRGYEII